MAAEGAPAGEPRAAAPHGAVGPGTFFLPVRVYYEDTDASGVVYHATYLAYLERARTEWLRARGIAQARLRETDGVLFTLARISVEYRRPARLDDELRVGARLVRLGRASLVLAQDVALAPRAEPLCRAEAKVGCVDARTFRPRPIPHRIMLELSR